MQKCKCYKQVGQHTEKTPPHKQHIWFLPTQKPTLEKPKELFFAPENFRDSDRMNEI
jgi:hypothetical protein